MASESDIKTRADESDIKAYAEKARRTVDELANEARSRGQDGAEALRGILSQKGNELSNFLEGDKGAMSTAKGVVEGAKGAVGKVVGGVGGAVEQVGSTIEDAAGQKKT